MGADISILFDHSLSELSKPKVESLFEKVSEAIDHVFPPSRFEQCLKSQNAGEWHELGDHSHEGFYHYDAPRGFGFTFGKQTAIAHHVTRFQAFLTEEAPRHRIRCFAEHVAKSLLSTKAIYLPDSQYANVDATNYLVERGASLRAIESELVNQGSLLLPLSQIGKGGSNDTVCYIDEFQLLGTDYDF